MIEDLGVPSLSANVAFTRTILELLAGAPARAERAARGTPGLLRRAQCETTLTPRPAARHPLTRPGSPRGAGATSSRAVVWIGQVVRRSIYAAAW